MKLTKWSNLLIAYLALCHLCQLLPSKDIHVRLTGDSNVCMCLPNHKLVSVVTLHCCNAKRPFPTLQKFTFTTYFCLISSCYIYSGYLWVGYKPVWAAKVVCLHMAHSGFGLFDPSECFIVGYFNPIVILTIFCGQLIVSWPNEVNRLGEKKCRLFV